MLQHFLPSAAARTLSLVRVARMEEPEARATFRAIRWADTDGAPVCLAGPTHEIRRINLDDLNG
jgi:hypothetical protein